MEDRIVNLEAKVKALNSIINTLAMSLSEVTQKNAEIGMHLAAVLKTIQDGRPLDAANLAASSVQNMVDKLDAYIKLALDRNLLKPTDVVADNSVVALQQLDASGNELVKKMLLNLHEQDEDVKSSFRGAKISQVVEAAVASGEKNNFVVLEIYEPTEGITEEIK